MSIYKAKNSPFYRYDFELGGRRFHGSTGTASKREAQKIEDQKRDEARDTNSKFGLDKDGPLTLAAASLRYWNEHGQHQSNVGDLKKGLAILIDYFGPGRLMSDITDDDVAKLVAWRRGHHKWNRKDQPLISPSTVNRSTTEILERLFVRARTVWRQPFAREPIWKNHLLPEPIERVRELREDEDAALNEALDPDYEVVRKFSLASGMRMKESLLTWAQVDFAGARINAIGKGRRPIRLPISDAMRELLMSRVGHHETAVFTYPAYRTRDSRVCGERYPITKEGLKTHWRRRKAKAGVVDYRWHDNRHDNATKLLRSTGNLKLVQRALNHAKIETTAKYAHVTDDELRAAMNEVADKKSRTRSRTSNLKVV